LRCGSVDGGGGNLLDAARVPLGAINPGRSRFADNGVDLGSLA
jgi:hypothetical protein